MKRFFRILRRWTLMAIILFLLITGGLFIYRIAYFAMSYNYDSEFDSSSLDANQVPDNSITNIALFGVDTRETDIGTRSDSMMILTVDNQRHKVKLISLMRDSRVPIEGHDEDKLCHAYAYGGPELAVRTINRDFGTNIQEYITVDFGQMKVLVDLVGGVYLDVTEKERVEANKFIEEYQKERGVPKSERTPIKQAGYQHLNGVQAMCYARIRKGGTGDDWGRVERQSIVLEAMLEQVQGMNRDELIQLAQKMVEHVTTSLSPADCMPLLLGMIKDGLPEVVHTRVPLDGEWKYSSSGQYIVYDLDRAAELIYEFIYHDILPTAQEDAA